MNAKDKKLTSLTVPASGESISEADVGQWMKKEGEFVELDETIVVLETDKAAMDVPSPVSGIIESIKAKEGDTVNVGQLLAEIRPADKPVDKPADRPTEKTGSTSSASSGAGKASQTAKADLDKKISPAPKKIIMENNLDPKNIPASGKDGRITKNDALMAVGSQNQASNQAAATSHDGYGEMEIVRMSKLRQTIAARLKHAQNEAAMLTTFNDVDMSAILNLRKQYQDVFVKKYGVKLGFMSFFVKACISALKEIPEINAEIRGNEIIYKNFYNISVAVGTSKGLFVPVLKNAEKKSFFDIENEIIEFVKKVDAGDISKEDMQDGTFTITNGGIFGSLLSTPIINPPQSGILGMHRIEERPVVRNGEIVIRPMMYLALSYDHRIVDGKDAVSFLVRIKQILEDPTRLALEL